MKVCRQKSDVLSQVTDINADFRRVSLIEYQQEQARLGARSTPTPLGIFRVIPHKKTGGVPRARHLYRVNGTDAAANFDGSGQKMPRKIHWNNHGVGGGRAVMHWFLDIIYWILTGYCAVLAVQWSARAWNRWLDKQIKAWSQALEARRAKNNCKHPCADAALQAFLEAQVFTQQEQERIKQEIFQDAVRLRELPASGFTWSLNDRQMTFGNVLDLAAADHPEGRLALEIIKARGFISAPTQRRNGS